MLAPPAVARAVRQRLAALGIPNFYFTAVHTHHGFGEWQTGPAGTFITGGYNQVLVRYAGEPNRGQRAVRPNPSSPTRLRYAQYDGAASVSNRLVQNGRVDLLLRVIDLKQDSTTAVAATAVAATAVLASFAAHATFPPLAPRTCRPTTPKWQCGRWKPNPTSTSPSGRPRPWVAIVRAARPTRRWKPTPSAWWVP